VCAPVALSRLDTWGVVWCDSLFVTHERNGSSSRWPDVSALSLLWPHSGVRSAPNASNTRTATRPDVIQVRQGSATQEIAGGCYARSCNGKHGCRPRRHGPNCRDFYIMAVRCAGSKAHPAGAGAEPNQLVRDAEPWPREPAVARTLTTRFIASLACNPSASPLPSQTLAHLGKKLPLAFFEWRQAIDRGTPPRQPPPPPPSPGAQQGCDVGVQAMGSVAPDGGRHVVKSKARRYPKKGPPRRRNGENE
jgi:hypothetical protein